MSLADEIRKYVLTMYIEPARRRGDRTVVVRAGDVHKRMGLTDRMPAVAGALGAKKFEEYANVQLIRREGPHQGANLCLTFELQ
jgi:5-methylcytosine-specific restriction protein B